MKNISFLFNFDVTEFLMNRKENEWKIIGSLFMKVFRSRMDEKLNNKILFFFVKNSET